MHKSIFLLFHTCFLTCLFTSFVAAAQVSIRINNVITVAATGTPAENCTSVRTVLGSILDSSETNPYHLKLEPGDYSCGDLGASYLEVPSFVVVEGAGMDATTVHGTTSNSTGLVSISYGSELRHLTVINEGSSSNPETYAVGLPVYGVGISARLSHVRAVAQAASLISSGLVILRPEISGIYQGMLAVDNSSIEGATHALRCEGGVYDALQIRISDSVVTAGFLDDCQALYSFVCTNSYDKSFHDIGNAGYLTPIGAGCEPIEWPEVTCPCDEYFARAVDKYMIHGGRIPLPASSGEPPPPNTEAACGFESVEFFRIAMARYSTSEISLLSAPSHTLTLVLMAQHSGSRVWDYSVLCSASLESSQLGSIYEHQLGAEQVDGRFDACKKSVLNYCEQEESCSSPLFGCD